MKLRIAIVAAAIPLIGIAGVANAQDRYPPSPTESPSAEVLGETQTNDPAPDQEVLPDEQVNPPASNAAPLAATGADVALLGLSGLAALTAGGGAVYATRRRS